MRMLVVCKLACASSEARRQKLTPFGYCSCTLYNVEQILATTHRECLAVICTVWILNRYLRGTLVKIRANHESLWRILSMTDTTGNIARWQVRLSVFGFDIVHSVGVNNQAAGALFRLSTEIEDGTLLDDWAPVLAISRDLSHVRSHR